MKTTSSMGQFSSCDPSKPYLGIHSFAHSVAN